MRERTLVDMQLLTRLLIILAALSAAVGAGADGGVYRSTAHGSSASGVYRDTSLPRGSCAQCHSQHAAAPSSFGLFAENYGGSKNAVCFGCHSAGSVSYLGQSTYLGALHDNSSFACWPGPSPPARPTSDFGNCANCHNPHGHLDRLGLVPSLAVARDGNLCLTCHDVNGPAVVDIQRQVTKQYSHSLGSPALAGRHSAKEMLTPGSYSATNRHIECVDCHNPHKLPSSTKHSAGTNTASDLLKGASGVEAAYSTAPWTAPSFTPRATDYLTDVRCEYEICFKCHSSWAYGPSPPLAPSGSVETDQSVEFNPNNASFHPVVDYIKTNSYTIPTAANGSKQTMEPPWDALSGHKLMYCSDCHSSESPGDPKGPHGSTNPYLLIAPTSQTDDTLCLKCHKASVYKPATDPGTAETGSRFDEQTTSNGRASHYFHGVQKRVGCRQCHCGSRTAAAGAVSARSAHGTNLAPDLMNGTNISSFHPGSCSPTCHGTKTYTAGPE